MLTVRSEDFCLHACAHDPEGISDDITKETA